jgi:flagellar hook-associated protein 2
MTWAQVNTAIQTATSNAASLSFGVNRVSLVSPGSPMQIGASSDTSNFLSATSLLGSAQVASGGNYTVTSNQLLGGAVTTAALSSARLATAINDNGGTGAFSVNGVSIAWTANDSLNTVLGRINSSSANVRASYDPTTDKLTMVNLGTGAQDIALSDTSGNFLAATRLLAGSVKTVGAPAQYTVTQNGVTTPTQYSNTNVVTNALPGVTLTLSAVGSTSVTVSQDTATAQKSVQAFVDQFNTLVDVIGKYTAYDPTSHAASVLSGDAGVRMLESQLRSLVSAPAVTATGATYKTLADIGVSTGAFGSALGTTKHLTLDTTKLSAALNNNPNAVLDVLSGLTSTITKTADPTNPWMASVSGSPYGQVTSGTYRITHDGAGNLSSVFTPTVGAAQPAVLGKITAGGTNSSLINGLVLTANASLPTSAGTDTLTFTVTSRGVVQSVNNYVNTALATTGLFGTETSGAASDQRRLDVQISAAQTQLNLKQQSLQRKFTAMESALAQLQNQSQSLLSQINANNVPR